MNVTASLTLCQYCEHANPADAKFCAGCGAPLHLIPCPLCGAVNQKTSKTCYQCHGQLRESTEILLADVPASASEEAAGDAQSGAMLSPYLSPPPAPQRQPIAVVAIVLASFSAAAYFAYQQRSTVESGAMDPVAGTAKAPVKVPEPPSLDPGAGAINKTPFASKPAENVPPTPIGAGKQDSAAETTRTVEPKLGKVDDSTDAAAAPERAQTGTARAARRRAQAEPAVSPEAAVRAGSGLEKQAPRIGPCTEGVAALGLCTAGPTTGKE